MQILVDIKQILPKPRRGWVASQLNHRTKQLQLTEKAIPDYEFTEALKSLEDAGNILITKCKRPRIHLIPS